MSELNSKSNTLSHSSTLLQGQGETAILLNEEREERGRGRDDTHVGATARMRTVSFSACVTVLVPFCREEGGSSWLDTHLLEQSSFFRNL